MDRKKQLGEIKKEVTDIPIFLNEDKSLCEFVAGQFVESLRVINTIIL